MSKSENRGPARDDSGWQCEHVSLLNGYCSQKALFYRYAALAGRAMIC
jgi:hypothetical protein